MSAYIRPQSAGEILRNAVRLYRTNFQKFFLAYLIPILPFAVLQAIALDISPKLRLIAYILYFLASMVAMLPVTVVLSDICLDNEPSLRRAFRRVFGRSAGHLVWTVLLSWAITMLGLLLCVVPGVVFSIWYVFAPTIVVLESVGGWASLKRSKELGKGFYLRNFGVLLLCIAVSFSGSFFLGMIWGAISVLAGLPLMAAQVVATALSLLLTPVSLIATVLMYYDMRARKEAYDNALLAEDLRR